MGKAKGAADSGVGFSDGQVNRPPCRRDTVAWSRRHKDSLKYMLLSDIEISADCGRRRRWSASEKLRVREETIYVGESVFSIARCNGVALNLLCR